MKVRGGVRHLSFHDAYLLPFDYFDHCLTVLLTGFDDFVPPDFDRCYDFHHLHPQKNRCHFDDSVRSTWHSRHYFLPR